MSGYESSFTGGEEEVEQSPQFQHDATDEKIADQQSDEDADKPASDDVLGADEAGMTG